MCPMPDLDSFCHFALHILNQHVGDEKVQPIKQKKPKLTKFILGFALGTTSHRKSFKIRPVEA